MNKDDDLNSEKMVEKCCSCVGWGLRSGTKKRWARATLTVGPLLTMALVGLLAADHMGVS